MPDPVTSPAPDGQSGDPVVAAVRAALEAADDRDEETRARGYVYYPDRADDAAVAVDAYHRAILDRRPDAGELTDFERSMEQEYGVDVTPFLALLAAETTYAEQAERRAVAAQRRASRHSDRADAEEESWRLIKTERDQLADEVATLRQHILDIDAHATPYGDLPGDPGWAGTYLVTAGALHRALGKIGHTAPKCSAEAERDALAAQVARVRELAQQAEPTYDQYEAGLVVFAQDVLAALDGT